MPRRIYDKNRIGRIASSDQIGKFPPRQVDFPEISNVGSYKHLIRVNDRMPYAKPKLQIVPSRTTITRARLG